MIILLSVKDDVHCDAISIALKTKHIDFIKFDVDSYEKHSTTLIIEENKLILKLDGAYLDNAVIYNRRAFNFLNQLQDGKNNKQKYIGNELFPTIRGFFDCIKSIWVNHPITNNFASNKLLQLKIAKDLNFDFPKTIVTNNYSDLKHFKNLGIIFKAVGSHNAYGGKYIYTSDIKINRIKEKDLALCSGLFQKKVNKYADIRVTVIGKKQFGAIAISKKNDHVDWRYNHESLKWERWDIPINLQSKILLLMKKLNLKFAAIDFVIDKNKNILFLEVNPNGQWLWIQMDTGHDIATSIANYLYKSDVQGQPRKNKNKTRNRL